MPDLIATIENLEDNVISLEETIMELRQELGDRDNRIAMLEMDRDNLVELVNIFTDDAADMLRRFSV